MTLHLTGCWPARSDDDPGLQRLQYDLWVASAQLSRLHRAACVTLNDRMCSVLFEWEDIADAEFIYDAFEAGS